MLHTAIIPGKAHPDAAKPHTETLPSSHDKGILFPKEVPTVSVQKLTCSLYVSPLNYPRSGKAQPLLKVKSAYFWNSNLRLHIAIRASVQQTLIVILRSPKHR
ncbi:hypothetical protein KC19_6G160100 [Ceratodon purpureus]|uniref:Uncharacterized protein n=1 Tax=Ceratodon purpureus TaxID=3225 RepID=A0A8T0HH24_CERPU|nr:hypothetical protein KC19_6G160100 [Ceratodon purpureus]